VFSEVAFTASNEDDAFILKTYRLQIMKVIINLISYEQPEFEVQTTTTISELKSKCKELGSRTHDRREGEK
jgi:hypothetical protein